MRKSILSRLVWMTWSFNIVWSMGHWWDVVLGVIVG